MNPTKRTIVEIGGGTTPYFVRYNIPWTEGEEYICIDLSAERIKEAEAALAKWVASGRNAPAKAQFLVQDGISLPMPSGFADEIILSNVLSAPIHYNWDKAGNKIRVENPGGVFERLIRGSKSDGDLFYRERKPLVQEALRVLRPGGKLSLYNDLIVYGQHSYERILSELKKDLALMHTADVTEQNRIDKHNEIKRASGAFCYCFDADVLPRCSVDRFVKRY